MNHFSVLGTSSPKSVLIAFIWKIFDDDVFSQSLEYKDELYYSDKCTKENVVDFDFCLSIDRNQMIPDTKLISIC